MIKWAASWWGSEIIAEDSEDEAFLREFLNRLHINAVAMYCGHGIDNPVEVDSYSRILANRFPLVLRFHRGD